MISVLISPTVLHLARERSQLEPEQLAAITHIKSGKLLSWEEEGETKPTFKQAQDIAKALHVPFGFLFLPHPPEEKLAIPDLRTVGDRVAGSFSADLRDLLMDVLRKQDWYRDHLLEQGTSPLPFINRFNLDAPVTEIATDVTAVLKLTLMDRKEAKSWEEFLVLLAEKAETSGVCIMRSGTVGSNTHRILDVEEFRGFAICDQIAPVVFINGKDARAAQIFTLIHELIHLWIGQSGISNISLAQPDSITYQRTEKVCNAVAAEVLVPQHVLREHWRRQESLDWNASQLGSFFRVSTVVVARRALDLGIIKWAVYFDYYQRQAEFWRKGKKGPGGEFYRTIPVRNGRHFTEAVVQSASERNLLLRDAGRLLGINPSKIQRLAQTIGIA